MTSTRPSTRAPGSSQGRASTELAAPESAGAALAAPPIDANALLSRCMGNVAFAGALLNELTSSGVQQVDAIVRQAESGDRLAAAETAHSLKGAAAIIGAESLRSAAAELETVARAGESPRLPALVHDLRVELDRCLDFIPRLQSGFQDLKVAPR